MHDDEHHKHTADGTGTDHGPDGGIPELQAVLAHTVRHSRHHEEELTGLAAEAEALQLHTLAARLRECAAEYGRTNEKLDAALALLDRKEG